MKLFKCVFFTLIITMVVHHTVHASHPVITFFIKEQKQHKKKEPKINPRHISASLEQPSFVHAIGKDRSWLEQPGVNGIYGSYLGYLTVSDDNGQITFPRNHQNDTVHLLITPQIEPEFMISPSLVHHWITKHNSPAALYQIDRKKNEKLNLYYFEVQKVDVPQDIPFDTIILYAHPDHMHVPIGISLNSYSTNLVLPELEAKKEDLIKNSLYTLSIKQYFEQIDKQMKHDMLNITTMVINQ